MCRPSHLCVCRVGTPPARQYIYDCFDGRVYLCKLRPVIQPVHFARTGPLLVAGMLLRRTARSLSSRAAESSRPAGPPGASSFLAYRRRVPGKKKVGKALQVLPPLGGRVSVHMMASIHDSADLVDTLRARFPSGVVQRESPRAALCCVAAAHTRCPRALQA